MAILSGKNLLLALIFVSLVSSSVGVGTRGGAKGKGKRVAPEPLDDIIEDEAPALLGLPAPGNDTAAPRPAPPSAGEKLYAFLCGHLTAADLTLLDQILEANGVYAVGPGSSTESQLNTLLRGAPGLPRLQAIGLEALGLPADELLQYVRALIPLGASAAAPAPTPAAKRRASNRAPGPKRAPAPKAADGALHRGPVPGPLRDAGQTLLTTRGPLRFVLPEAGTSAEPPAPTAPPTAVSFPTFYWQACPCYFKALTKTPRMLSLIGILAHVDSVFVMPELSPSRCYSCSCM